MPQIKRPSSAPSAERNRPKLTNRGPAGLLKKLKPETANGLVPVEVPEQAQVTRATAAFRITPALQHLAVPIDTLVPDPVNARMHPERNMQSIVESLQTYGQVKPLVVRKANRVVIAGNGTLEAAKLLGWDEIAVNFVDMNEVEAAGYGLADNRTAELAKWDFEVVARLDRLLLEAGHASIGWSSDELEVLRAADWTPPPISDNGDGGESGSYVLKLEPGEAGIVLQAIEAVRLREEAYAKESDSACLAYLCSDWLGE